MATIDGPIFMKMNINLPQTIDDNISKYQLPMANGLVGVWLLRLFCFEIRGLRPITNPEIRNLIREFQFRFVFRETGVRTPCEDCFKCLVHLTF